MRLPFGLGRRSSSGDGAEDGDSDTGLATADASPTPAVPTRAWAALPPIQRTTGAMPLVAAPDAFVDALSGSRGLPPIVEPLGHEVSNLATPGLVVARSRSVVAPANGSMPAPVQRRAARATRSASLQREAAEEDGPGLAATSVTASAAPVALEAIAEPELPLAPIRSMPTVSRQSVHVPDRPLTSAASAARPAAVQRAEAAAQAAASGAAALPMPVSGGMRRVPSGTSPAMPVVSRQAAPLTVERAAAPVPAALPAPVAQRSATSAAPRTAPAVPSKLGLGEPMTSVPAAAHPLGSPSTMPIVSRSTAAGPMPVSVASLVPTAQRSAAESDAPGGASLPVAARGASIAPVGTSAGGSVSVDAAMSLQRSAAPGSSSRVAQRLPALPVLPVARPTVARMAATRDELDRSDVSGTAPAPAATAGPTVRPQAAPEIRPIAAANPIRPSFVLQRSAADADDEDAGGRPEMPSPWWASAPEPRPSGDLSSVQRSSAPGAPAAAPRSVGGPAPFGQPAHAAIAPTIQRSSSVGGRPLPPARGTAPDPVARSGAGGASAAPISVSSPASTAADDHVPGITNGPVVQTSAVSSPWPSVQRVPGSNGAHVPTVQREDPPAGSGGTSGGTSGTHASSGGGRGHSERELEELSQMLFSRIRTRLRLDLIHDREAKGLTFDNV